jgi:hypothetical protein
MNPSGAIEVFVFKDGRFLGSRCYSQTVVTVGRGRGATLKLMDPSISEQHAVIRFEAGSLVLSDAGSQSGVFVNGERIGTRKVSSFDEVSIGPFRLKVSVLGQDQEEDPGFGGEADAGESYDNEAATVVRKVQVPGYEDPPAGMEEATLPRIVRPPASDGFDQQETHALGPRGRARSAAPRLDPRAASAATYEEVPTKAEIPARKNPTGSFEDFSRQPAPAPAPAPARAAPARAAPARAMPQAAHTAPTRKADSHDMPVLDEEPLEQPAWEEESPEEIPDAAAAASAGPFDEDDEDEIENWVEPFSLLENVVREKFKSRIETEPYITVEVIHYQGSEILDLLRANPGKKVKVGIDRYRLVNVEDSGRASLYFKSDFKGTLVTKGKARSLKTFMNERFQVKGRGGSYAVSLTEGDYAQIIRGSSGYLIRFVRPPTLPKSDKRVGMDWSKLQIFIGSAAFHFLILVLLGFVAPEADLSVVTDAERFAKVAMKDLKLEKPKKKEEIKVDKPPDEPKPKVKEKVKVKRRIKGPARPMSAKQKAKIQKKQVKNVLSALENLRPRSAGPGRSDLKKLVSNIAAVRAPGGTSSSFKVAGVISKIPGGGVRLAGGIGGGGGKDTRVGSQLLAGGNIGKIKALKGTGGRVRGRVRRAPKRAISATGGILDRGAIQKVVNAHMAAIQRCYEVQLLKNPGLAGKIVFDWVIALSGGVSSARQASSSMRSPAVATCILSVIRGMRFPSPVGGSVQVRYPFVFRVQGF